MENKDEELCLRIESILQRANLSQKKQEMTDLEKQTYETTFWQDSSSATETMKKIDALKKEIDEIEMMQLFFEEKQYEEAEKIISKYEIQFFLSQPYDRGDTIFAVHAGQGGTEAMDWASILYRMYVRYFEKKDWKFEEVDRVEGEEAGIKSIILNVYGQFSYGYLKAEEFTGWYVNRLLMLTTFVRRLLL